LKEREPSAPRSADVRAFNQERQKRIDDSCSPLTADDDLRRKPSLSHLTAG
jgi:hypothetical protein